MNHDDLTLLVGFREEVPTPDEETTRRIYQIATTSPAPRRRLARPKLALAAGLAALVAVPTAVAFRTQIIDLFEGTPAPPAVSSSFVANNRVADIATQNGFGARFPQADVSKAHGVLQTPTIYGPIDLWAAPNDHGGVCWFIDFANDPPGPNGQYGYGGCDEATPPPSNIDFGDVWWQPHPAIITVYGRVYVPSATVQLTLQDGSIQTLPVVEGFFLGTVGRDLTIAKVAAYNSAGEQTAKTTLR